MPGPKNLGEAAFCTSVMFYFVFSFFPNQAIFTAPDNREHAMGPIEVATQTSVTVYLLSLSQTTASTVRNNVPPEASEKGCEHHML